MHVLWHVADAVIGVGAGHHSALPEARAQKDVGGLLQKAVDATREHIEARQAAEGRARELNAVFDSMPDAVVVFDAQGAPVGTNKAGTELVCCSHWPEDMDRVNALKRLRIRHSDGRPVRLEELPSSRALCGETVENMPLLYVGPDGKDLSVQGSSAPLWQDGKVVGAVSVMHDVTRQEQLLHELATERGRLKAVFDSALERRLAERTAVAEQRTAQLQAMALNLTQAEQFERARVARFLHDHLQQLLVGAKLNLGALLGRVDERDLVDALAQVDRLLDQSLDASRSLATELSPPILHDSGLAAALDWLARQDQSKYGLTVEVTMEGDAEPASRTLRVFLFHAVQELLLNVIKHAGVDRARVQLRRADGQVEVRVTDTGAGFEPGQVRTSGGTAGGFGLLSLRERVELLGGLMEICSAPGCGTAVSLRAPLGQLPASAEAVASAAPEGARLLRPARPRAADGRIRVLLADDHHVMRQGLVALLEIEGDIEVVGEAADGNEAVELARRLQPDVVVMDVTMPHMSGVEATRAIAAELPHTRVIGLSMHDEADMAARMIEAGAEAYLNKAGPSGPLIAAIRGAPLVSP